jgi:ZPR1 zinc finger domain
MSSTYEALVLDEPCTRCNFPKIEMRKLVYMSPNEFEVLVFVCPNCGYHQSYIADLNSKKPVRYTIYINQQSDLNTLIYRSPQADIAIPELGLEVDHTGFTQAKITTVEGFLLEAKSQVDALFTKSEAEKFLAITEAALKGRLKFTFILDDESGASWVKARTGTNYEVEYQQNT